MFEHEAIYGIVTHIGNLNMPEEPPPIYSLKAGGNGDTWLKHKTRKEEYAKAIERRNKWFSEARTMVKYMHLDYSRTGYWAKSKREALAFFLKSDVWADVFIREVFGNATTAYLQTATKEELAECFLSWFEKKREELRKSMKAEIQTINTEAEVLKISGKQITHGGIANLLKVLTRTMEKQGADIRSIAKVQYAICKQAGILIPDEFIEDVAVILTQEG